MAPNLNKAEIIGHCGKDVDLRYTASGKPFASVSVATSSGKDDSRTTEWHNVVAWDDLATLMSENFKKGDAIHVSGPIRTRSWEDKEGNKRYTQEILCWYLAKPLYKKRDASQPPKQTQQQPVTEDSDLPF